MYGESSDEEETTMADSVDILKPIIEEFSIKSDVNLQNFSKMTKNCTNSGISLNK